MLPVRADAGTKAEPSGRPQTDAAAASVASAADAGDDEWALSEDDGADDEATLDAEEQAALADGLNVKVSSAVRTQISLLLTICPCWVPHPAAVEHHRGSVALCFSSRALQ